MNINLEIKEEPEDSNSNLIALKQPVVKEETSSGAAHDSVMKYELKRMISECKSDAKIEIKEEPLTCDTYFFELKQETEKIHVSSAVHDAVLKEKEETELHIGLETKISVEELKFPVSDTGANKDVLSNSFANSSNTSFNEVKPNFKDSTKMQTVSSILHGSTLTTPSSLKEHTVIIEHKSNNLIHKSKKAYKCDICEKAFTKPCHLKIHLLIHDGKKPHKCNVCGKGFALAYNLKVHLLTHAGKKPHKCEVCGKSFTRAANLREHILIHEGKKPHKCEVCEKNFTHASNLRKHNLIHEGKKPHKCEICEKNFTMAFTLRKHLLIHKDKKVHQCKICGKSFTNVVHLQTHYLVHQDGKPHKC